MTNSGSRKYCQL